MKPKIKWRWHKTAGYALRHECTTSAWAKWYAGIDLGWAGLGVVRESWGWRIMLGIYHLCGHIKNTK
jgi:hypothetical protein